MPVSGRRRPLMWFPARLVLFPPVGFASHRAHCTHRGVRYGGRGTRTRRRERALRNNLSARRAIRGSEQRAGDFGRRRLSTRPPMTDAKVARPAATPPPGTESEIAAAEAKRAAAAASEPSGEAGAGAAEGGEVPSPGERPELSLPAALWARNLARSYRAAVLLGQKASQYQAQNDKALQATLARALGTSPLPPDQAPSLVPQNSPFVDRAGNIRLDTLTTREDARGASLRAREQPIDTSTAAGRLPRHARGVCRVRDQPSPRVGCGTDN